MCQSSLQSSPEGPPSSPPGSPLPSRLTRRAGNVPLLGSAPKPRSFLTPLAFPFPSPVFDFLSSRPVSFPQPELIRGQGGLRPSSRLGKTAPGVAANECAEDASRPGWGQAGPCGRELPASPLPVGECQLSGGSWRPVINEPILGSILGLRKSRTMGFPAGSELRNHWLPPSHLGGCGLSRV